MRRCWIAAIAVVALLVIGAAAFRAQVGTALLARLVDHRAGIDSTRDLPDGLHVGLCGTGSPLPDPTRAGPCTVVIAGKHIFVVDAGEGGARHISLMGIPNGRIEALFLTHFHSDHIDGLGPMLLLRWSGEAAKARLPVYGPPGVERVVAGFNEAYALDAGYRTAHHGPVIMPPSGAGGVAMPFAMPVSAAPVLDRDGVRVTAFAVDHGPVHAAVGYRFDYKGRSVVISGDTAASSSLVRAARGADLLVHEGLQPELVGLLHDSLAKHGQPAMAQVMRDILNYHASPELVAREAEAAGVKQLVFSHIIPPLPTRIAYAAFLGRARQYYRGPVTVGEDGMFFSLPANSTEVGFRRMAVN